MVRIFIDPGHGGSDPGAVANGLYEKDLTLDIALRLRDILLGEYTGVEVRMSRETDTTVSLEQRVQMANSWGADYFLSIHINAGGGTGFESYIYTSALPASVTYQNIIHPEIVAATGFYDRGKKRANFYVLRATTMPALLTENGFIDNANDAAKLKDPNFRQLIARGHANALAKAFGLQKKASATLTKVRAATPAATTLHRVVVDGKQVGAFQERANVLRAVEQALGRAREIRIEEVNMPRALK